MPEPMMTDPQESHHGIYIGNTVRYEYAHGVTYTVIDIEECCQTKLHPEPHNSYRVLDPKGNIAWFCGHTLEKVN